MANLHRLVFVAVVLFSAWLPTSSFAATVPATATTNPTTVKWPMSTGGVSRDYATAVAACQAGVSNYGPPSATYVSTSVSGSTVGTVAQCRYGPPSVPYEGNWGNTTATNSCVLAGGVTGSSCVVYTCPDGMGSPDPVTHLCTVPLNNCSVITGTSAGTYGGAGGVGAKGLCNPRIPSGNPALPGCLMTGKADIAYGDPPNQTWSASMTYTGASCAVSAGNPDPGPPPNLNCPVGQVIGYVNGEERCYKPGPETPKSTTGTGTTTTTNPDGSTTRTDTTQSTNCNAAGSCSTTTNVTVTGSTAGGVMGSPVTTTTTSVCTRGSPGCQTTATTQTPVTTTTNSTGTTTTGTPVTTGGTTTTPTGSSTTTTTSSSGGAASGSGGGSGGNGNGNGGGDGGMFSGVCGAPPICDGDAVMCAVAAATFTTNCTLKDPKLPTPLYDAAITKTGDQTTALAGNSTVSVASSQFDQTELLGGASGMTDRVVTVAGRSISIPFSSVNIWLQRLGVVLQAVTFLVCARIVIRG